MAYTLADILHRIRVREASLRRLGVDRLSIFGSRARGTASDTSDLDVLVHFSTRVCGGYFAMARVKRELENELGIVVDVEFEDSVPDKGAAIHEWIRAI